MHLHTRRELLPLLCALGTASKAQAFRYDLIVKGGRVIDPSQSLSAPRDVAISGDKVARVDADIPSTEARLTLDARGKIVTPGLVDIHVHVYDGVAPLGIPADPNCIAKGATTVVDAGSAGAHTFPGFRRMVIDTAALRLAREAAEAVNLPLMAHIGGTASPLAAILKELRKGDVISHSFHGHSGGILDSQGRVLQ